MATQSHTFAGVTFRSSTGSVNISTLIRILASGNADVTPVSGHLSAAELQSNLDRLSTDHADHWASRPIQPYATAKLLVDGTIIVAAKTADPRFPTYILSAAA